MPGLPGEINPHRGARAVDDTRCLDYFLQPSGTFQRQYEVLRAYFVERRPLDEIASQFGLTYDTLRSLVRDFRADRREGIEPPFSRRPASGDRSGPTASTPRHFPRSPPSRIDDGSI
jgi:hypothetical protein